MASTPILAYWDIRGLAQAIRLLLGYTKTTFENKLYACGEGPDFDKTCWTDVKFNLGFDFPNLPYYVDGDIKITQSNAILRHVGRKNGLDGKSEAEKVRVDIMENQIMDLRNGFIGVCYRPGFTDNRPKYIANVAILFKLFQDFLGDNNWLAGPNITFVDFHFWELLDQHLEFESAILDDFPKLRAFHKRFLDLPEIKEYMASDHFFKGPINNRMAAFK